MKETQELKKLRLENADLRQKLNDYIPRRRVRRVYKQLKSILEEDNKCENRQYLQKLRLFVTKIEKEGPQVADQEIKTAIEHLLSIYDLPDPESEHIDLGASFSRSIISRWRYDKE